jgi:hypothetical protein
MCETQQTVVLKLNRIQYSGALNHRRAHAFGAVNAKVKNSQRDYYDCEDLFHGAFPQWVGVV